MYLFSQKSGFLVTRPNCNNDKIFELTFIVQKECFIQEHRANQSSWKNTKICHILFFFDIKFCTFSTSHFVLFDITFCTFLNLLWSCYVLLIHSQILLFFTKQSKIIMIISICKLMNYPFSLECWNKFANSQVCKNFITRNLLLLSEI